MLKLITKTKPVKEQNHLIKSVSPQSWAKLKMLAHINKVKIGKMIEMLVEEAMKNEK